MAKYTALMMVALLALAGANASRELKSILDPITSAVTGTGGLLGAGLGAGNGGSGTSNAGQGNGANVIGGSVGSQTNNGQATQYQVCQNSCNGAISVGCCTTIGNIANNNNVKVIEFCNGNVDQCCVLPSIKDVTAGVTGIGATLPIDITELTALVPVLGTAVQNGNVKRCA